MRKYFGVLAALLLLVAPVAAQDVQRVPLAIAWDMDGVAADVDFHILATQIADSKSDYVISGGINDVCRLVNLSLVDGNSSVTAGVFTVTGTDCWGDALTCTYTATGAGSGTYALTYATGTSSTCAFSTVTQLSNGAITGEGGAADTVSVGYPVSTGYKYPIYGIRKEAGGRRFVDPFAMRQGADTITVNGTAVASFHTEDGGAFQGLAAQDLVYIVTDGQMFERRLVAVASDDAATLDTAIPTNSAPATTAEIKFLYKNRFILVESNDAWVPVQRGRESAFFIFDVDANANTGGVVSSIECSVFSAFSSGEYDPNVQVDTDTVASAATGTATTSIDLSLAPYTHCRGGLKFGTEDDADGANEDLHLYLMIVRRN